jgi:hypothetical protein
MMLAFLGSVFWVGVAFWVGIKLADEMFPPNGRR